MRFGNDLRTLDSRAAFEAVATLAPNVRKLTTDATRAPLPSDDETQGYAVGSRWLWQGQEWVRSEAGWVKPSLTPAEISQAAQSAATDAATQAASAAADQVRAQVAADADRAEAAAETLGELPETISDLAQGQRKVATLDGIKPLLFDGDYVAIWQEGGKLRGPGLADADVVASMSETVDVISASMPGLSAIQRPVNTVDGITPKIAEGDVVTLWEENGQWHGPGIGSTGGGGGTDMEAVRAYAEPRRSPRSSSLPILTDGRDLWLYRLMLGQVDEATLRLIINGDSWAGMNVFATALRDIFAAEHTIGGAGWWSPIAGPRFGPGGYSRPGSWTEMDVTNTASAVPNELTWGSGIDGHMLTTTGTDAQAILTNFAASEFRIFSRNHGGTWRYLLNGAAPVVVNDSNDGALKVTVLTGLNPDGGNNLTIDTVGNTGRVAIGGYHLSKTGGGIEILQSGNGGSMGLHWSLIAPNIPAIAENLQPHACITFLGTNDYRYVSGTSSYIHGLRDMRDAYRSVIPDMGFLFVAPARSAGIPLVTPQVQLRDALYEFCISEGHEFYNMHDDWPAYAVANARGMWTDTAHPSMAGYRSAAARIYNHFLRA